jgi:hypothetical protein
MNFKYYDILSHLIPGLLIYAITDQYFDNYLPDLSIIPQLAIAYIVGYFNNTLSSWLEGFYRFITGGNPINKYFNKKGVWKVRFYKGAEVKQLLKTKITNQSAQNKELFTEAMRIAYASSSSRLEDLNASYAFSRGILTAILITGIIVLSYNPDKIVLYVAFIILFLISLVRTHQRDSYYIREVLNMVLKSDEKKST